MKNSIKHFLLPLVCGIAFISCEKQTTPEPVQIQRPELQSPIVRDDVYYARLRAYKKTDHKLAFGWFGSWTAINPSEQSPMELIFDITAYGSLSPTGMTIRSASTVGFK